MTPRKRLYTCYGCGGRPDGCRFCNPDNRQESK